MGNSSMMRNNRSMALGPASLAETAPGRWAWAAARAVHRGLGPSGRELPAIGADHALGGDPLGQVVVHPQCLSSAASPPCGYTLVSAVMRPLLTASPSAW